ncbi:hypothetical protein DdX_14263 [Ditylenchus destructor]|uniref:Uncharacterized protein n=1 Tax=Ditylenchus destructor TaxID=166010 RepID=A0AAD4R1U5_9BILA|nr:hypothetical protein DdX_14263 [Ditylenchus destructor]
MAENLADDLNSSLTISPPRKIQRKRGKVGGGQPLIEFDRETDPIELLKQFTATQMHEKLALSDEAFEEWIKDPGLLPRIRKCPLCNDIFVFLINFVDFA